MKLAKRIKFALIWARSESARLYPWPAPLRARAARFLSSFAFHIMATRRQRATIDARENSA